MSVSIPASGVSLTPVTGGGAATSFFGNGTGTTVTSGNPNSVLYENSGGFVATAAGFTYDGTTVTVPSLTNSALTSGRVPFATTGGLLTDSGLLTYTTTSSAPRFTVGDNSANITGGLTIGGWGIAGQGAIWAPGQTPSTTNHLLRGTTSVTEINVPSAGQLIFAIAGTGKFNQQSAAGVGLAITAGTNAAAATTYALNISQTLNNAAALGGLQFVLTDTLSGAGGNALSILGTSSGAANLFKVTKAGVPYGGAAAFLIGSTTTLTNGAAAQLGTLTNAPTAGNPTKFIPIDDNGTTRYVPAW